MNKNMIKSYLEICENIKKYEQVEFDHSSEEYEEVFDYSLQCPLAYTTKGDNEEFEIQVTLDLKNNRIIKVLSHEYDDYIEYEDFKDWEEIAIVSESFNFDELIMTDIDVDVLIEQFTNQKIKDERNEKSDSY